MRRCETKDAPAKHPRNLPRTLLVLGICLLVRSLPAETASDYQVKAAYLFNFAKLGEWPRTSLPEGGPFVIGVVGGDNDFVRVLQKTVSGKLAGTHALTVKHLAAGDNLKACQLLFFRDSEQKRTTGMIADLGQAGVLLVGEDKPFLRQGGMVNLVFQEGMIRFEINPDALEHSGIRFAPEVLAQAQIVHASAPAAAAGNSRRVQVRVAPDYPQLAQRMSLKGTVQVEATVARDGTVKKVKLVGGHPLLVAAAVEAVMKWKYEPASAETVELVKVSFGSEK